MKHNLLKSVIISVILLMGVSNAWAATITGGTTLYLKPNSNWLADGARFAAYLCNGSSDAEWYSMSDCNGDGIYEMKVNSGKSHKNVIFCRMNPGNSTNDWNNKWTQTGDLTWDGSKNLYTINNGSWDAGSWSVPTFTDKVVYFKPFSGWKADNAEFMAYAFDNCSNNEWKEMTEIGCAGEYYTCTIPAKYNKVIFARMNPSRSNDNFNSGVCWNKTGDLTIPTDSKNLFTLADAAWDGATATWGTYTASTYSITKPATTTGGTITVSKSSGIALNEQVDVTISTSEGYTYKSGTITIGTNAAKSISEGKSTHTICGPTTINAQWTANKYTVTLNNQGATTAGAASVTATYGDAMPSIAGNLPQKTGYTFNGYYDATSGGTQYYKADGTSAKNWDKTAATTLYAQWTPAKYTITYKDQNNATFSGTHADGHPTTHTYGTETTLKDASKAGYTFGGWHTDATCTQRVTSLGATAYTDNITLYAKWDAKKFTLKWDENGGTITTPGSPEGGEVEAGTPLKAPTVTKDHYDHTGWNPEVPAVMPGEDVTYTAQWTAHPYTIKYHLDGGTGASNTTYTIESEEITLPTPTKTGFTFAGWYDSSEFNGEEITTIASGSTGDKEFWAKWNIGTYTVTLDRQSGEGGTASVQATYGAAMPKITIPAYADHLFDGYYDQTNGQGTKYYNADGTSAKNWNKETGTLYAKWIPYSQCIFFKNNLDWANVYVYFYSSDKYWNDSKGTGSQYNKTFTNGDDANHSPHWRKFRGQMTNIKGTDIWYIDYKTMAETIDKTNASEINGYTNIAFTKDKQDEYEFFDNTSVIRRGDFNSNLRLFIPEVGQTAAELNQHDGKSTKYYNEGLWMKYNSTESGLYWSGTTADHTNNWQDYSLTASKAGGYTFTTTVSFAGNQTYDFKIKDLRETWFGNSGTMTKTNHEGWHFKTSNNDNAHATSTAAGRYTFTVYLGDGKVMVSLDYPLSVNDYRLAYMEGENTASFHPGHTIKKHDFESKDTVSFYINLENTPYILLQRCSAIANDGTPSWETLTRYPVLKTDGENPNLAKIHGKRNTDDNVTLYLGNGCGVDATGVYNFTLHQDGTTTAQVLTEETHVYEGKYYVRTDAAEGGWNSFRQDGNKMTYSSYAAANSGFTHYFCKWVENVGDSHTNVRFTVANDYSYCISDSLDRDDIINHNNNHDGFIPISANIRFSWNSHTNEINRAYLLGAGHKKDRFLVLQGNDQLKDIEGNTFTGETGTGQARENLNDHEVVFDDMGNWIYQVDVTANKDTKIKLTAKYNDYEQLFVSKTKSGDEGVSVLNSSSNDNYKVRMIYDFKTNNLIAGWLLDDENPENIESTEVATNMLIIRKDQNQANQINFTQNKNVQIYTAYAVMTFTKDWVTGAQTRDRSEYWVSFPFDVKISDVFGFGEYGDQWIMQLYDGEERAEKGYWAESKGFWKYITNRDYTLKAGVGYVLKLNLNKMTTANTYLHTDEVSLFFPSQGSPTIINAEPTSITVPPHECTIERDNRNIYDSHWNLIGVPGYANLETVNTSYTTRNQAGNVSFYYAYNAAENIYAPAAAEATFKNLYAYMVQFAGTIDWKNYPQFNNIPQQLAARRNSDAEPEKRTLRLEIAQGEEAADQTFVQLQQEGATPEFDMNLDLTKIINSGANIYTLAGDARIQVAGNALPVAETTIPVGVQMATAGEYTFRMPDGTEGMVVELIDYETNTRTNLLLSDYTTTLPAGSFENRFALIVKPDKVATDVENIGQAAQNGEAAKKYIIDGKLYLQKGGLLYDAQGHIVR